MLFLNRSMMSAPLPLRDAITSIWTRCPMARGDDRNIVFNKARIQIARQRRSRICCLRQAESNKGVGPKTRDTNAETLGRDYDCRRGQYEPPRQSEGHPKQLASEKRIIADRDGVRWQLVAAPLEGEVAAGTAKRWCHAVVVAGPKRRAFRHQAWLGIRGRGIRRRRQAKCR